MKLHFWAGLGAAHKATAGKADKASDGNRFMSVVIGVLLASLALAGFVWLLSEFH
jgi:hypothetical protein